jgi:hypothetical protein
MTRRPRAPGWKDYKAVALSNGVGEGFFQDNPALQTWSTAQPLNAERKALRHHLWQGEVEQVWPILKGMGTYQADCFRRYLEKHRHRLPNYGGCNPLKAYN